MPSTQMDVLQIELTHHLLVHAITQHMPTVGVRLRSLEDQDVVFARQGIVVGLTVEEPVLGKHGYHRSGIHRSLAIHFI